MSLRYHIVHQSVGQQGKSGGSCSQLLELAERPDRESSMLRKLRSDVNSGHESFHAASSPA